MPKVRKRNWTETADAVCHEAASDYLSLLLPTETAQLAVVELRNGSEVTRRTKDLLRASGRADLPAENPSVARKLKGLRRGKLLSAVLCLRGDPHDGSWLTIAGGYRRIGARYLLDEGADIPCRLPGLSRPEETLAAAVHARPEHSR
jgi:hypothetical protein